MHAHKCHDHAMLYIWIIDILVKTDLLTPMKPNDPVYLFNVIIFVEGPKVMHVHKFHDYTMLDVGRVAVLMIF